MKLFINALLCLLGLTLQAKALNVVTTIKPLYGLTAALMEGTGKPKLLLDPKASEHTYTLKPSDILILQEADLVVWVGPSLESFLAKPLQIHTSEAKRIALIETPDLHLLPTRTGEDWTHHHAPCDCCHDHDATGDHDGTGDHDSMCDHDHDHDHHHHEEAHADHHHGPLDAHLWLDPHNALKMAHAIYKKLVALDPKHQSLYTTNLKALTQSLTSLDTSLYSLLKGLAHKPFFVFHDAYQYLEDRYGLKAWGTLMATPDMPPSAQHLHHLKGIIAQQGSTCVFFEPQFSFTATQKYLQGLPVTFGVLDPLGADLPLTSHVYEDLMIQLANSLKGCLVHP